MVFLGSVEILRVEENGVFPEVLMHIQSFSLANKLAAYPEFL